MTEAEFVIATRKGQGRALLAARNGEHRLNFHAMRRLMLRWPALDSWFESYRGWFTVELLRTTLFEEELTQLVIAHLKRIKGRSLDRRHKEAVVLELAKRGSAPAREAIYNGFNPASDFRFADEIIELDGLAGLDWLITHSAEYLVTDNARRFHMWIEDLSEVCSKEGISEWLALESTTRPEVARFAKLAASAKARPKPSAGAPPKMISYQELRRGHSPSISVRSTVLRWVSDAGDEGYREAWLALAIEEDPEWLRALALRVRGMPKYCDIDRIIELAGKWKAERNPFALALENVVDPRVRRLGFDLIAEGWVMDGVNTVVASGRAEDAPDILAAVQELTGAEEIHSACLDLLRLADRFDARDALLWVYEATPCSECREFAVRKLIEKGPASKQLLSECLLDCVAETREMAATALAGITNPPGTED